MNTSSNSLSVQSTVEIFQTDGQLSRSLKRFEARNEQQEMVRDVVEAYNDDKIALIEAGTGTGKSLAYLIPAVLWALKNKQRTVISTKTITLQEQLLEKDIPLIKKALNIDFKAVLVKGMANYLCLRKLEDVQEEMNHMDPQAKGQLEQIEAWSNSTRDGSRSALSFIPHSSVWERVRADGDACNGMQCPHYEDCFFFKARRRAANAQLLVINHHLLFADLSLRIEEGDYSIHAVLPPYDRLILDEAHNIEDVATDYFAFRVTRFELKNLLLKLSTERHSQAIGKLFILKDKIRKVFPKEPGKEVQNLLDSLEIDFPGQRRLLYHNITQAFQALDSFLHLVLPKRSGSENALAEKKLRFREEHFVHAYWKTEVAPGFKALAEELLRYAYSLKALKGEIHKIDNKKLIDRTQDILLDITGLTVRLEKMTQSLQDFVFSTDYHSIVRWVESSNRKGEEQTVLVGAKLDVSHLLAEHFFSKFSTIVLCSATLATMKNFGFIRQRLGILEHLLNDRSVIEKIYLSPFDYKKQVVLGIPTDMPFPHEPNFVDEVSNKVLAILKASWGNAFVLFTSFHMLRACYDKVSEKLIQSRFHLFKQGDDHRQTLLNRFKATENSVLFGTDSFWEGVDVVGDALRCVIIVKLPFQVPTEPIIQARTEEISRRGGNSFMEYSVPSAIVKFKQGIGRLIRNKKDRGSIICLDTRLLKKPYGKHFINSIPDCNHVFEPIERLEAQMKQFYKRTHHFVK